MSDLQAEQAIVIRYLLGDVTDEERDQIGERSVVDLQYGEFVQGVELELIESYVRNELDDRHQSLFEQRFLVTRERRDKVSAMSAIVSYQRRLDEGTGGIRRKTERKKTEHWFWSFLTHHPIFATCVVIIAALLVTAEVYLIRDWQGRRDAPLIAMGELTPKLRVETARGADVDELQVRSDAKYVVLLLAVSDLNSKYIVELHSSGKALWRQEGTPAAVVDGEPVISVLLPTSILKAGQEYIVAWQSSTALPTAAPSQARYRIDNR
jgi:hypothetical protein